MQTVLAQITAYYSGSLGRLREAGLQSSVRPVDNMKKSHTMRIDSDLLKEIDRERKKQRPIESTTRFFERAAWERLERLAEQKKGNGA